MSNQSKPQEFVVLETSTQADFVPFGYDIVISESSPEVTSDQLLASPLGEIQSEENKQLVIPHIIQTISTEFRTLPDATVLADVTLLIESQYSDVELRVSQGGPS